MRIEKKSIDELVSRVRISEIISPVTKLKKEGAEHSGLCPFHKEKTPSFRANDAKGLYYCFGCKESGGVITFVQNYYNMDFVDAVKFIAEKSSFTLSYETENYYKEEVREYSSILKEILKEASKIYIGELNSTKNISARKYLESRKISSEVVNKFLIGYAPDGVSLISNNFANYDEQHLIDSGLVARGDNGKLYDRFRGRIMFPIFNSSGEIIAFGGRNIINDDHFNGKKRAKYINSPSTPIFQKGNELYAMNFASIQARKNNRIVVTEGYMDAIALHKAGFSESVANLGTAITIDHLHKLWKLCDKPIICLDGDEAGIRAMSRTAQVALPSLKDGKSLAFAIMPKSTDPDDIINRNGLDAFEELIDSAIPLSEMIWRYEVLSNKFETPEQKASIKKKLHDIAFQIEDKNIRYSYVNFFNERLRQKFSYYNKNKYGKKVTEEKLSSPDIKITKSQIFSPKIRYLYGLISLIIEHESLLDDNEIMDIFTRIDVSSNELDQKEKKNAEIAESVKSAILENYENDEPIDIKLFLKSNNFEKELDFLCGESSVFIDQFTKNNPSVSKCTWMILSKKYDVENLKEEREKQLKQLTEQSHVIATMLQNDIFNLENKILQMQENLHEINQ